uniref:Uncharacterized protein n=1 Tax=Helianthus annuus TaxID=4232 RepID=A0A251TSF7_HELAN
MVFLCNQNRRRSGVVCLKMRLQLGVLRCGLMVGSLRCLFGGMGIWIWITIISSSRWMSFDFTYDVLLELLRSMFCWFRSGFDPSFKAIHTCISKKDHIKIQCF